MTCGAHRKRLPNDDGPAAGIALRPRALPPPPDCRSRTETGPRNRPQGRPKRRSPSLSIPINRGTCHAGTVKLASVQVAKVMRGGIGEPPRPTPPQASGGTSAVQSLAQEGAVPRCPSVVRKPTWLSLETSVGGHPPRARRAARRPCGTPRQTCAQPAHHPRSESDASPAPVGEAQLCPTVGRCVRRGTASPAVRTPSVQSRRSVSTSVCP